MRWKASKQPQRGDRRNLRCFALVPKRVGEHWVWLGLYYVRQEYWQALGPSYDPTTGIGKYSPYGPGRWMTLDTCLAEDLVIETLTGDKHVSSA